MVYCMLYGIHYPCQSASGDASRPVGVDLPVNHAEPSDDSRLKYFKSVCAAMQSNLVRISSQKTFETLKISLS